MGVFFNFDLGGECAWWEAPLVIRAISTLERLSILRTYKKAQKHKDSFLCSNESIISTKEARKLLGKADSDKISDLELAYFIGLMRRIASDLIDIKIVHSGEKVV